MRRCAKDYLQIPTRLWAIEEMTEEEYVEELNELLDWIEMKHKKLSRVIPFADKGSFHLHGEENICVGCLQIFVKEYSADIPLVKRLD